MSLHLYEFIFHLYNNYIPLMKRLENNSVNCDWEIALSIDHGVIQYYFIFSEKMVLFYSVTYFLPYFVCQSYTTYCYLCIIWLGKMSLNSQFFGLMALIIYLSIFGYWSYFFVCPHLHSNLTFRFESVSCNGKLV